MVSVVEFQEMLIQSVSQLILVEYVYNVPAELIPDLLLLKLHPQVEDLMRFMLMVDLEDIVSMIKNADNPDRHPKFTV